MATLVLDRELAEELRQQRAESGADRWDEVWEGTYYDDAIAKRRTPRTCSPTYYGFY